MHLHNRCLPRPSASSPLDNRAQPMANTSQVLDLEGLHREIHNAERSHRSHRSGDHFQNHSTGWEQRERRRSPSLPLPSETSSKTPRVNGEIRKGRSPRKSVPVTMDALVRQTEPPFTTRILKARVSSRFKLSTQLGVYKGKTDPMDHLDSYKSLMMPQGCSDEVMCKAFFCHFEGIGKIMSQAKERLPPLHHPPEENRAPEGLWTPAQSIIQFLSKNVLETLSALQNKVDKYIATEELAEAKPMRRGKDDSKRKEPDNRRSDYRDEARNKRSNRDSKQTIKRCPPTPPH
ncbi:hypothetical protein Acr_01g0009350 [Actinidia rufa]|uniref:Uncharacterized protein n=1 Tax=Actinidia rufa TaxID=165716 RepID=A0A7J0E4N1_9ERIC|nr:hypothetical protein Acr_01g0009350 [Actinidia rufa]